MPDYVTLAELKAYLRIGSPPDYDDDTADDLELGRAITTASAEIDHLCSRTFELVGGDGATTRYYEPWYDRNAQRWVLWVDDLFTAADLMVSMWNGTDAYDVPITPVTLFNNSLKRSTIVLPAANDYAPGGIYDEATTLAVLGNWGWVAYPEPVKAACILLATRIFKRRESAFGLISTLDGSEQTRLTRATDPDVAAALAPYIRYWAIRR